MLCFPNQGVECQFHELTSMWRGRGCPTLGIQILDGVFQVVIVVLVFGSGCCGIHQGAVDGLTKLLWGIELQAPDMVSPIGVCAHFFIAFVGPKLDPIQPFGFLRAIWRVCGQYSELLLLTVEVQVDHLPHICWQLPKVFGHYQLADISPWLHRPIPTLWEGASKGALPQRVEIPLLEKGCWQHQGQRA